MPYLQPPQVPVGCVCVSSSDVPVNICYNMIDNHLNLDYNTSYMYRVVHIHSQRISPANEINGA